MGWNAEAGGRNIIGAMPAWVPSGALHYLAHTESGHPIRALAREAGCHASTVLRQIRKVELRRDDPLVDGALQRLGALNELNALRPRARNGIATVSSAAGRQPQIPDDNTLEREALRVLSRLAETGAVLAIAGDLDKAVVVRDVPGGGQARTAVLDTPIAQALALKDWIAPLNVGRIIRYRITMSGRAALGALITRYGSDRDGADGQDAAQGRLPPATAGDAAQRYGQAESPLAVLARRRDKSGKPFLAPSLVQAGERMREDFELSEMEASGECDWTGFVSGRVEIAPDTSPLAQTGPGAARERLRVALMTLGPGLSDVALHCCCYLEGLEMTEKRLGWSARSGKIVLRIALSRLQRHYEETLGPGGGLIG